MPAQINFTRTLHASVLLLQNKVSPIIGIDVRSDEPLENARVDVSTTPAYMAPVSLSLGEVKAHQNKMMPVPLGEYDHEALMALTEMKEGRIKVQLRDGDKVVAEEEKSLHWHPHDVWVGGHQHPELLAGLVWPDDPAVEQLMQYASEMLAARALPSVWSGYAVGKSGVVNRLHAIWNTVVAAGLEYSLPPECWVTDGLGQKVRTPQVIMRGGKGTCLDTTLMLAAMVAKAGLNPLVILVGGHAFLGVMLKDESLPNPVVMDVAMVRNLMQLEEVLVLETTMMTGVGSTFAQAQESARLFLMNLRTDDYFCALDVVQIWSTGVRSIVPVQEKETAPLSIAFAHQQSVDKDDFLPEVTAEQLEAEESLVEARPRTRMETWQLKLLDLSLRNNLLNTRMSSRRQIGLMMPDVAELEDRISRGVGFRIKHLPDVLTTRVAVMDSQVTDKPLLAVQQELSEELFRKNELLATDGDKAYSEERLAKALQGIYLAARHDLEETGSNTLYLACGFLRWYRRGDKGKSMLAPVLLIPVRLVRPSVKAGFTLRSVDEEPRINMTMLELLKTEFDLRIPELEGDLPTDEHGLDVQKIFSLVRQSIRHLEGWEIVEQCSLGIFSFAKYLMWKDMVDRQESLLKNPVVAHIASAERSTFPEQTDFPDPATLDNDVDPSKVFTPLSSDSSQLSAVLAAARGKSFVLIGPPGTGKSQTIANMIAHCLGHGKTVLFVAEKSAALSVVHKRLRKIGLSEFCLELHSSKANKKDAIAQFRSAIAAATGVPKKVDWGNTVATMETLRYTLNTLPWELHRPYPDGTSLYDDICRLAEAAEVPTFVPFVDSPLELSAERKAQLCALAEKLALYYGTVRELPEVVLAALASRTYSFDWEEQVAAQIQQLLAWYQQREDVFARLTEALDLKDADLVSLSMVALGDLLLALQEKPGVNASSLLPGRAAVVLPKLQRVGELAELYRNHAAGLSLPYPETAPDDPELATRYRAWKEAELSNFIFRFFGVRKARKYLRVLAFSSQNPDCRNDFERLLAMKAAKDELLSLVTPDWAELQMGLKTTPEDVAHWQQVAQLAADETLPEALVARLMSGQAIPMAAQRMLPEWQKLSESIRAGEAQLLGLLACDKTQLPREAAVLQSLLELRMHWRDVTLWNKVVDEARVAEAGALVDVLTAGTVAPSALKQALLTNMSRLRMRAAADAVQVLNEFTPVAHEDTIERFTEQDALLMKQTTGHVRELLAERAAQISQYGREIAILQREIAKQRAHMPLRKLLEAVPNASTLLKPCMLMSPLSVAQYLTPESAPFDVVIFDEASQIPVWDAVGALARGRNAIVVGDPRQMPPTSFFSRSKDDEDESSEIEQDMESILDECLACGIPELNLSWHYRSKAESLIAFSNHHYYDGRLTTFPAPVSTDTALQYHHVRKGVYLRGAGKRVNPTEARALVDHVLKTLRAPDFNYTEFSSIGIVTFNMQQQQLIVDMLEEERAKDESLEPFFSETNPEAIFVKNLENVQGDERGVIYFSTTYGPDERGVVSMNFGPLNLVGGERRLNVAITRARCGMHVFSSLRPEDINLNRTKARGAADFRGFLECARMGAEKYFHMKLAEPVQTEGLAQVIERDLVKRGWECKVNVGASDYRVDIAVKNPECPDAMLAGIMLDGPSYINAKTARDRDVLRHSVMQMLGWRMKRVWAMDWWRHPVACMDAVDKQLREWQAAGPLVPVKPVIQEPEEIEGDEPPPQQEFSAEPYTPYNTPLSSLTRFEKTFSPQASLSDDALLAEMMEMIRMEGPVAEGRMMSRMGRLSDTTLTASVRTRLRSKVELLIRMGKVVATEEIDCEGEKRRVLRLADMPEVRVRERGPREWQEIPCSEICELAMQVRMHERCLNGCEEHLRAVSSFYGITRITKKWREFLLSLLQ